MHTSRCSIRGQGQGLGLGRRFSLAPPRKNYVSVDRAVGDTASGALRQTHKLGELDVLVVVACDSGTVTDFFNAAA